MGRVGGGLRGLSPTYFPLFELPPNYLNYLNYPHTITQLFNNLNYLNYFATLKKPLLARPSLG